MDLKLSEVARLGIEGLANTDNHTDGTTNKVYTAVEKSKLSGVEAGAQVNLAVGTTAGTVAAGDDIRLFTLGDSYLGGNVSKTLSTSFLRSYLLHGTPTADITYTLPTGANMETAFASIIPLYGSFVWAISNKSSNYKIVIATNTNHAFGVSAPAGGLHVPPLTTMIFSSSRDEGGAWYTGVLSGSVREFGTAANAALTTSNADTTAGRVTKVGDYGWGGRNVGAFSGDANTMIVSGNYELSNTGANRPLETSENWSVLVIPGNNDNNLVQIASARISNRTFTRTRSGGTWGEWKELAAGGTGDVMGPASAVDSRLVSFDGTTGKLIKDSGRSTPSGAVVGTSDVQVLLYKTMSTGSVWWGTAIGAQYGGTGQTTYATGDILYASASNTLSKLPAGDAGQVLTISGGTPTWGTLSSSFTGNLGNGDLIDRPYENYVTAGGTKTWPDNTTPENSLLRIGLGTAGAPRALTVGNAPCGIFMQNYVKPDFGPGSDAAYTVGGANFDSIVTGGIGGVCGFSSTVYKIPGTYTGGAGIVGGRFGVDARTATHYEGILTGLWAYTHGDRFGVGGIAPAIEINAFCNQAWDTTANYSQDPFWTNGKRSVQGLLINNYQHAVAEYGGTAGQYQNTFGIALTSLGPGGTNGRAFGYQTGLYLTDCSKENIRIRGGVIGTTEKSDYGIKFEGNACNIAGIALGPNKFNWGGSTQTVSNNGDMLYNSANGIMYFNQLGVVGEVMVCPEVVAAATSNVVNRKIRVKIGGVNYYLLANTGWD